MSLAAVMIVKDEQAQIARWLESVIPHVDAIIAVDTGSTDDTPAILRGAGAKVIHEPWEDFSTARNQALSAGREYANWLLMLDADMTIEAHPGLREWLDGDPDTAVSAWQVSVREQDITYRLPLLTRAGEYMRYEGATHEALTGVGKQRPLLGLTVTHHVDGANRADKHQRDLELLADGVMKGEPRSTYYAAQALRCLGRIPEAAELYARRAAMEGTWEEERWHAQYMASRLTEDIPALVAAYEARPHRPEPLEWAARIIRQRSENTDVLFLEREPGCQS